MKKILLLVMLISSLVNAEEHVYKSDAEFFREMAQLDQQIQEEKRKQAEARAKTLAKERELESARNVGKKLDELKGVLSN